MTWDAAADALAAATMRAAAALDIDHETVVPSGGEDHDGPAASEGEPHHDSGGPL